MKPMAIQVFEGRDRLEYAARALGLEEDAVLAAEVVDVVLLLLGLVEEVLLEAGSEVAILLMIIHQRLDLHEQLALVVEVVGLDYSAVRVDVQVGELDQLVYGFEADQTVFHV